MSETDRSLGAAEQLILRETPKAYQFAYRLTRNADESKELVQETSYRILLKKDAYDASRPETGWFQAILHNLFIDSRRSFEHRHGVSLNQPRGDGFDYSDIISSHELGVSERLEREEDLQAVRRITRKLHRDLIAVLRLIDMEGRSYEEAARILGIPTGTVRSRVSRARQAFRLLWAKENLVYG